MARISTYNLDGTISNTDKVLGTDSTNTQTKNFRLQDLKEFTYAGISGPVTINPLGVSSVTFPAITLGTDTSGDYVKSLVAGGGIQLSNNSGETATPTVKVNPLQTTITSILNASLCIGRDATNKICFTTDNQIRFTVNNALDLILKENALTPGTSDGTALGDEDAMWSDLFLASLSVINFNNGNVTVTHSAAALTINTSSKLQFHSDKASIHASADGQLDIDADDEIELSSADIDIDASNDITIDADDNITVVAVDNLSMSTSSADGKVTIGSAHTSGDAMHIHASAAASESILDIDAGILDIDVGAKIEIDAETEISIDSKTNSNFTVTGADQDLTLGVATSGTGSLILNSAGTGADAIDVNATAGGIDIDVAKAATIDAELTSNFTVAGSGQSLNLTVSGAGAQVLSLNSAGTGTNAIDINATGGGVDIVAAANVSMLAATSFVAQGNTSAKFGDDTEQIEYDGSGNLDIDAVAIDLDASGAITIDGTSTVSIDGAGATNLTTSSGNIIVDSVAGSILVDGHTGVEITSTDSGTVVIDGKAGVSIEEDGTAVIAISDSRDTLFSSTGGSTSDPDVEFDGYIRFDGQTEVANSTVSNGITSGALVVDGGVGVAKKLHVGVADDSDTGLIAAGLIYPVTDGSVNQHLTTNGSNSLFFKTVQSAAVSDNNSTNPKPVVFHDSCRAISDGALSNDATVLNIQNVVGTVRTGDRLSKLDNSDITNKANNVVTPVVSSINSNAITFDVAFIIADDIPLIFRSDELVDDTGKLQYTPRTGLLQATTIQPISNNSGSLGATDNSWSDLFLATGSIITFDGSTTNTTLTHTDNSGITLAGTQKFFFNDSSQSIHGSDAKTLNIVANSLTVSNQPEGEIQIDANLLLDINTPTTDISNLLQVGGNLSFTNDGNHDIVINSTAAGTGGKNLTISAGSAAASGNNNTAGGDLFLQSGDGDGNGTSDIIFKTKTATGGNSATERMRINNAGIKMLSPLDLDASADISGNVVSSGRLLVTAADGVSNDNYVASFINQEATDGSNFGLTINAGSNANDIALNITDHDASRSLLRVKGDGNAILEGSLNIGNGTVSTPGLNFAGNSDAGFYNVGGDNIGFSANGAAVYSMNPDGITLVTDKKIFFRDTNGPFIHAPNANTFTISVPSQANGANNGIVKIEGPSGAQLNLLDISATTTNIDGALTVGGALNLPSKTAKHFFAAPTANSGAPGFRAIAADDIPTLNQNTEGSAATLTSSRNIAATGDIAWDVNFNGAANSTAAAVIPNNKVTHAKYQDVATNTIIGRTEADSGDVKALSKTEVLEILNVEDGATADQTKSDINGLAITTVGTINNGTWQGTAINQTYLVGQSGTNTGDQTNITGTAAIATAITVADESSDTTCFPLFVTAATGNLAPKSGSNLTFNSSSGALVVSGAVTSASTFNGTNFVVVSDRRLKSEIEPIKEGLEIIKQFTSYNYIKGGEKESGFIAQEVREVIPHTVYENNEGMLSMSDRGVVAHMHKAILELEKRLISIEEKFK